MPHQCLNCGHIIPKGSYEILKGCSQCNGKKFIYVSSRPLSEKKREEIKERADRVRADMLGKIDSSMLDILRERGISSVDGAQLQVDSELGHDWIRYEPLETEEFVIEEGEGDTELELHVRPRSAKDMITEYDSRMIKKEEPSGEKKRKPGKPKKPKLKKKKPRIPKKEGIDVIKIVEKGVYEIDVKGLLEDSPIIVQKDGSYLLHLPTLFGEKGKKRRKR